MSSLRRAAWLALALLALGLVSGCASQTARDMGIDKIAPRKAEKLLTTGIQQYEDGNYRASQKSLNDALDAGLAFHSDQVAARKYLAFIYCSSGQERACRDEFRRVFELDPQFTLDPTEEGHPIWGPIYRNVKAEMAARSRAR
jgi:Tfp pilus assembly protein PilF